MPDRRKRMKQSKSAVVFHNQSIGAVDSTDLVDSGSRSAKEESSSFMVQASNYESGSFSSRCSVRLIHEVVSKFEDYKKELVRSTGFEGILQFPSIRQIHRKFSLWLMSCVKEDRSSIVIGDDISMSFNKYDVGHVFGIPSSGKVVLDNAVAIRDAKVRVIHDFLGQEFNERRSVKIVQEIIDRKYEIPMSKADVDRFKVAFVVFVVSNLLCPSAKYDYASVDYWNALQDPDEICRYDWCGFVITKLLDGVSKLKHDIANNIKYPNLSGCSIFLQVIYLDSLHLAGLSFNHDVLPRVCVFSYDIISKMISADINFNSYCNGDAGAAPGKLRDPAQCIYSWAVEHLNQPDHSRSGGLLAIWDSAVAMAHLLNIPLEAAGPLFVAAADFQDQIDRGEPVSGRVAIKFMTVLVSLMIPYSRGFRYQSPYASNGSNNGNVVVESAIRSGIRLLALPMQRECVKQPFQKMTSESVNDDSRPSSDVVMSSASSSNGSSQTGTVRLKHVRYVCPVQRSIKCAIDREYDTPVHLNVNSRVASAMARFYSLLRKVKVPNGIDMNGTVVGRVRSELAIQSPGVRHVGDVPSPWEIGYVWPVSSVDVDGTINFIRSVQENETLAIVHRDPKYIQVHYRDMCAQLLGYCEMELDLFDALIRLIIQGDDILYGTHGCIRWRLFFESDFMGVILSGLADVVDPTILDHLALSHMSYDLSKTEMVFFPALLHCKWVVFVWHPLKNLITVFDPSLEIIDPEGRAELIERSSFMLKLVLKTLNGSLFTGLSCDPTCADISVFDVDDRNIERHNRSGLICSMFCRCFNGSHLSVNIDKLDLKFVGARLFHELGLLMGNSGAYQGTDGVA